MSLAGGDGQVDAMGGAGISILVVNQIKHLGQFKPRVKPHLKSAVICHFLLCSANTVTIL